MTEPSKTETERILDNVQDRIFLRKLGVDTLNWRSVDITFPEQPYPHADVLQEGENVSHKPWLPAGAWYGFAMALLFEACIATLGFLGWELCQRLAR